MATIYNMAGTTSHTFTLGDGTTIFYGVATPSNDMGKIGDIYVQTKKEIYNADLVKYPTSAADPGSTDTSIEVSNFEDYPSHYQRCYEQTLPVGAIVKYIGETSGSYNHNYYYQWNGTSWDEVFNGDDDLGRVWYKEKFDNKEQWNFVKSYTFDDDIIHAIETSQFSNNWKISIESADNSGVVSSTKANDYTKNHSAYGVTRFATNSETYAQGSGVDKFIVETPAQIKADINVEKTRAEGVEQNLQNQIGDLTQLTTPVTSDLVSAANDLQRQIQVIVDKKDVVDLVEHYSDLIAYDTATLGDNDVIKVLSDETNSDATTFYRWVDVPSTPDVSVATKAALDAYSTTGLQEGDVAKVTADETHSGNLAYYEWEKINGTYGWKYAGPSHNDEHPTELHYWSYIGEEGPFYTKSEADGRFVHLIGSETIQGAKTFQNKDVYFKSPKIDTTDPTTTGHLHLAFRDKNNIEFGHVKSIYHDDDSIETNIAVTQDNAQTFGTISVRMASNGTVTTAAPAPTDTTSTSSKQIATVGWVNTVGNNVVHLTGNETITGTKTMTGATVLVATQSPNDNSTKAASTAYVDALIKVPAFTSSNNGQYLGVETNSTTQTTSLVWKSADNIALNNITDVTITSPTSGQVLIYDSTLNSNAGGWKNGSQVTATIKYW